MSAALPRLAIYLASGQLPAVPEDDAWLSEAERAALMRFRIEQRRGEWRLGRWLARRAVLAALAGERHLETGDAAGRELAIIAAADGAPEVHGARAPVTLSISHSHGRGLAAAALGATPIGCDLELIEPRSERFVSDWLTTSESGQVSTAPDDLRPLLANLCWSAKEAASKVCRVGLRSDTRSWEVVLPGYEAAMAGARSEAWAPITVNAVAAGRSFPGYWRARAGFVETVLAAGECELREGAGRSPAP